MLTLYDGRVNKFPTLEAAYGWLSELVDDDYVGNYRFKFIDSNEGVSQNMPRNDLEVIQTYDLRCVVGNREVVIGCDFGH